MPEFYMSKYSDHRSDGLMARLMRWQERMSAGLAHVIITANDNFKRNLIQRGISEGKISVVNNLPDTTIFDRDRIVRSNSEKFTLIYPGTIAPRYGLHIAVRAMPLIVDEIPNVQLRIIGGQNDYCVELIDLARELGAAAYIEFHPAIPIAAVPIQMANADIGIYPALPDPHMSIATPSKTLEFALMGLPIVASRLDVLVDMLPEDGVAFIEPGNVEEFAAAVLTLYRDPSARRAMTQIMNEVFVHNHSWEQEAERYMNILAKWIGAVEDTGQQDSPASLRSESPERIL
jgi:glycosyltransferase involved in cell wall biosynthesis